MSQLRTVHAVISGRVQGVWYRGWTRNKAQELGLNGWVRNRLDGTVEAVFSGPTEIVEHMIDACWDGSPAAQVDDIVITDIPSIGDTSFVVKGTA